MYYQMETDFGLVVQDKKQKYASVLTVGRVIPVEQFSLGQSGLDHMYAREYYLRTEAVKTWWLYVGLIEKVYGLRNVDHTSFQRAHQGFNVIGNDYNGAAASEGLA